MDQSKHPGDFAPEEQSWASDLPHHPSMSGPSPTIPAGHRFPQQLSLPQEGLQQVTSTLPAGLPPPSSHGPVVSPPDEAGPSAFVPRPRTSSGLSGTQEHREILKAKRRVPAAQRKRTQVSCDACKTRRCKCVRLGPTTGSDDESTLPPCKLCTNTGIPCVTTMPRKQRVYGSVENLDRRYRALEALVVGLFPDLNPRASAEELVDFGRRRGIAMPEFTEGAGQPNLALFEPTGSSITSTSSTTSDHAPYLGPGMGKLERNQLVLPPAYFTKSAAIAPQLLPRPSHEGNVDSKDGYSGLVSDSSGRPNYIGPSGSLAFLGDVRRMIYGRMASGGGQQTTAWLEQGSESRGKNIVPQKYPESLRISAAQTEPKQFSRRVRSEGAQHLEGDEPFFWGDPHLQAVDEPNYWRYHKLASAIELPPKDEADMCVDAFFHHVHPNFILFHRSSFQRAYDTLWTAWEAARKGVSEGEVREVTVTTGWLVCLYMIFVFGSRSLPQTPKSLEFQRRWHAEVERLPPHLYPATLPNACGHSKRVPISLFFHTK